MGGSVLVNKSEIILISFSDHAKLGACCHRQVRLVSFFVSSLFVPDAERAIVLAWRGMFLTRTEISRFFFMLSN